MQHSWCSKENHRMSTFDISFVKWADILEIKEIAKKLRISRQKRFLISMKIGGSIKMFLNIIE